MVIERDDGVWLVVRPDNHNLDPADHADHAGYDGHAAYPATTWTDSGCTPPPRWMCRDGVAHGHIDPATVNRGGGARGALRSSRSTPWIRPAYRGFGARRATACTSRPAHGDRRARPDRRSRGVLVQGWILW